MLFFAVAGECSIRIFRIQWQQLLIYSPFIIVFLFFLISSAQVNRVYAIIADSIFQGVYKNYWYPTVGRTFSCLVLQYNDNTVMRNARIDYYM